MRVEISSDVPLYIEQFNIFELRSSAVDSIIVYYPENIHAHKDVLKDVVNDPEYEIKPKTPRSKESNAGKH